MSTVTLTKESHKNPDKFRITHEDGQKVLGPNPVVPVNDVLPKQETYSKVTIVGSGFGGIGAAMTTIKKFNEQDYAIFEKHDDIGGTWYANTYPGCASDIPAVWYSFFDELNTNWSDVRPPQYEVEEYLQLIVKKYDIKRHCKFSSGVQQAIYDDKSDHWVLKIRNLKTGQLTVHTTKVLVNCTGGLVVPNVFNPPGLDTFEGDYMHSGIWNYDVSFKGKKVVAFGNGCSAAQVLPELLKNYEPESITQVIRSKHYIFPPLPKFISKLYYLLSFSRIGIIFVRWLIAFFAEARYPMYTGNSWLSRGVRWLNSRISVKYMKQTIPEKYHDLVIPDYKIGCKRLIFDYFYAPSLNDPRIDVVNEEIDYVDKKSIKMKSGKVIEADIIVACTGYNIQKSMAPYEIVGRNGIKVSDFWEKEGVSAYETALVKHCPNYFIIAGPNSATGHSSVVLAIENGCEFYKQIAGKIIDGTYSSIEVKAEKYNEWLSTIQNILKDSVFGTAFGGCISWYSNDKVNSTAYPYSQITYLKRMRNPKWGDFNLKKADDKKSV